MKRRRGRTRAGRSKTAWPCRAGNDRRPSVRFFFFFLSHMHAAELLRRRQPIWWHYWRARGCSSVAKRELPLPFGAAETARNSPGRVSAQQRQLFFLPFGSVWFHQLNFS